MPIVGVLHECDPALAALRAINRHNCRGTFEAQRDRVEHFIRRINDLGFTPEEVLIVLINVDQVPDLALHLVPDGAEGWAKARAEGQTPFARGLVHRPGFQEMIDELDPEIGARLRAMKVPVLVMDFGVINCFEVTE